MWKQCHDLCYCGVVCIFVGSIPTCCCWSEPSVCSVAVKACKDSLAGLVWQVLQKKRIGVVAHFYMDPEVQGVLSAAGASWPHIHVSDSLVMADAALRMVQSGCRAVCVLGVDFMSENVRAIMDEAGYNDIPVSLQYIYIRHHVASRDCNLFILIYQIPM